MTKGLDDDIKEYLQRLTDEIIELKGSVGEVQTALAVITVEVGAACKTVEQHEVDIGGNGKPGLKADMIRIDSRLGVIEGKVNNIVKVAWGGMTAMCLAVVNSILDLVIY